MAQATPRIVILVFERNQDPEKYVHLKEFIRQDETIRSWWHYIPTAYLLETDEKIDSLTEKFVEFFNEEKFFLAEMNPASCNGWLPERAWHWIHKRNRKMEYST